jgi:hypothetical protein
VPWALGSGGQAPDQTHKDPAATLLATPTPATTPGADDPETTTAMSDPDPDRTRLGSHQRDQPLQ